MRKLLILLCLSMPLVFLAGCMDSGYRLSFREIDDLADDYPAQAQVFLSRADSNEDKGYYKLLAAKIAYQIKGYSLDDDDIDGAIRIFKDNHNEPLLARALYYKGVLTLNNSQDTTQVLALLYQAGTLDAGMREKEKLDMYDLQCRLTCRNKDVVKLEDEAKRTHHVSYQAWAMLYRALNDHDDQLAQEAFAKTGDIKENRDSTLGPMLYYYFQKMMDRGELPDSILWRYAYEATRHSGITYGNKLDIYRFLWSRSYETYGKAYMENARMFENSYFRLIVTEWDYNELLSLYFIALHHGDVAMANELAHELRKNAPVIDKCRNRDKEEVVKLMYEGGNTRYRYEKTKTLILYGIIFVLVVILVVVYLYISRMRRARQTIQGLQSSLHQLKNVENTSLSQRCEDLNHHISLQLLKLKRREKDIEMYREQISELTNVSQGLVYYAMAIQNKNISQIGKMGIRQLLLSFKMIDEKYAQRLEGYDLNPSQSLFCLLYHIGKTDEEVMQILQYSMSNVRVRKSRIKADAGEDSFENIIQ